MHVEGVLAHVHSLTLVHGGELRLFPSGATAGQPPRHYRFAGTTVVKATAAVNASQPYGTTAAFRLHFGQLVVEGGGRVTGKRLEITASHMTVDDGGVVDVSDGGHLSGRGKGEAGS